MSDRGTRLPNKITHKIAHPAILPRNERGCPKSQRSLQGQDKELLDIG
jgi:hypothetical protein